MYKKVDYVLEPESFILPGQAIFNKEEWEIGTSGFVFHPFPFLFFLNKIDISRKMKARQAGQWEVFCCVTFILLKSTVAQADPIIQKHSKCLQKHTKICGSFSHYHEWKRDILRRWTLIKYSCFFAKKELFHSRTTIYFLSRLVTWLDTAMTACTLCVLMNSKQVWSCGVSKEEANWLTTRPE